MYDIARSFCGSFTTSVVKITFHRTLGDLAKRKLCSSNQEWLLSPQKMELSVISSCFNEKQSMDCSKPISKESMPTEKKGSTSIPINQSEAAWHESRKKWIGDPSRRPTKMEKDPIISWSMTYDELLSNNEPFPVPIPLPEMVDFLVDIWHDEGLFD